MSRIGYVVSFFVIVVGCYANAGCKAPPAVRGKFKIISVESIHFECQNKNQSIIEDLSDSKLMEVHLTRGSDRYTVILRTDMKLKKGQTRELSLESKCCDRLETTVICDKENHVMDRRTLEEPYYAACAYDQAYLARSTRADSKWSRNRT